MSVFLDWKVIFTSWLSNSSNLYDVHVWTDFSLSWYDVTVGSLNCSCDMVVMGCVRVSQLFLLCKNAHLVLSIESSTYVSECDSLAWWNISKIRSTWEDGMMNDQPWLLVNLSPDMSSSYKNNGVSIIPAKYQKQWLDLNSLMRYKPPYKYLMCYRRLGKLDYQVFSQKQFFFKM